MKILVTGAAGFIGHHVVKSLVQLGHSVVGIDSLNNYYDVNLKYARLKEQGIHIDSSVSEHIAIPSEMFATYCFVKQDIKEFQQLLNLFEEEEFDRVCHLAAQAGVRYSLKNPHSYIDNNISGTLNLLEACRLFSIKHFVFASSSSVYGLQGNMPFSEKQDSSHPVSMYAVTKKSCEMMAHSYSHLYGLPVTGLRFFTVYGPWGRPDMAPMLFADAITESKVISVYNHGNMSRDFTFISDITDGIVKAIMHSASPSKDWDIMKPDPSISSAPYRIYNIGNSKPVKLMDFIDAMEKALSKKAILEMTDMQAGDIAKTWADVNSIHRDLQYSPRISIEDGVQKFVLWYKEYYGRKKSTDE